MLCVFLVGDKYEQPDSFLSESDIGRVEALNKHHLPSLKALLIDLYKLVKTADAKIFHVVVSIIEELIEYLNGLFNEIVVWVDITSCFDCLL
jgi:hypothetical protein